MAPQRTNGFMRPFAGLQIATWVWLPILLLQFLFFVSPILVLAASIPCTLIFFGCAFAAVYYGYQATVADPMDVHLAKHLKETSPNAAESPKGWHKFFYKPPIQQQEGREEEPMKYCWVCETSVAQHSMHCKYCNKCISHFDHHCQWLNTCIGEVNYDYFFKTLVSICALLVVHTAIMVGLVIDIFVGGPSQDRADDWFNAGLPGLVAGVNIFFIVANLVSLSLVTQLLAFHIGLRRKNMSTYEFILSDNAAKREAFQKREERRTKRATAVAKAKQEGKPTLACRLQMGQHCAACDPLPDEEAATDRVSDQVYTALTDGDANGASMDRGPETNGADLVMANGVASEEQETPYTQGSEVQPQEEEEEEVKDAPIKDAPQDTPVQDTKDANQDARQDLVTTDTKESSSSQGGEAENGTNLDSKL